MSAYSGHSGAKGLRGWWLSTPRSGLELLINPWEYKHLRLSGGARVAGGTVGIVASLICASYGVWGWAAFFFAIGALNLAGGGWYFSVARSQGARA